MGGWIESLKKNERQQTNKSERSFLNSLKDSYDTSKESKEQLTTENSFLSKLKENKDTKHSWELSEEDMVKIERKRKINALKFKGIDKLKEEWTKMTYLELIKLARNIGAVINDQRYNGDDIDTILLSYLDELLKILETKDTSGPEMEQIPWAGKTLKEIQEEKDEEMRKAARKAEAKQKELEELRKIKSYIEKVKVEAKQQQKQKKLNEMEEEIEEYDGMSM